MSTTQAASSTAEASEQTPSQATKTAVLSSTPNHTSGPSIPPQNNLNTSTNQKPDQAKQNGSVASSRRSDKVEPQPSRTAGSSATPGPNPAQSGKKKQKGGVSNLFSFLNCCGGSRDTSDVDLQEHAIPAQRATKVQETQQVPVKTQDVSAAESSTAESKDVSVEKIGGTPYADLKSAGEPRTQEQAKSAQPSAIPEGQSLATNEQSGAEVTKQGEGTLSSQAGSLDTSSKPKSSVGIGGDATTNVPLQGESIIHDRTPQQEKIDTDIEMTEAPPVDHTVTQETKGIGGSKPDTTPPLPPPPPIIQQQESSGQPETPAADQTNVPNDQQRWLLPPVKAEHKGRKCLVLDLDETLVHSSFKVFSFAIDGFLIRCGIAYVFRFCTKPISRYQ